MTKTKKKKAAVWILLTFLAGIAAVVIIGPLLVCSTPGTYQPAAAPTEGQVSPYLTHKLGPDFFNNIQLDQPFELVIEQAGANEIFASQCPKPEEYAGFFFSAPAVSFHSDKIILMTTVGYKDATGVLSVVAYPEMDAAGQLNLNIRSVRLGSMPITPLARKIARQYANEYMDPDIDKDLIPIVNNILNNDPFSPVVTISEYKVRIKEFKLETGKLILTVEPVKGDTQSL